MKEKKVNDISISKTDTMKLERFGRLSITLYKTPRFSVLIMFADYLYQISISKVCSMIIHIIYRIVFI